MTIDKLTKRQAQVLGAYTGITCSEFGLVHEYVEELLGRPVFTHEMASKELCEEIKKLAKPEFLQLCY